MTGTVSASCDATAWARAAALLALLAAAGTAAAQTADHPVTVTEVVVTGNHAVNTNTILHKIKTRPGRPYDPYVAQEDIKALTATGSFRDVRIFPRSTPDGRFIVEVHVEEPPNLIQEVKYKNARHLKPEDLDSCKMLRKGTPLNPTQARVALNDIKAYYQDKGYYFADVVLEEGGNPGDTRIVFNVTEGPVVRVRHTYFVGNDTLATQARLRTQIDTSRMFLGMPVGGTFRPALVNNDVLKVLEYYKGNGYLEATVSRQLYFSDDFRTVDVIFDIHEGPRYRVKDVRVDGAKNVTADQLKGILKLKPGDWYNETTINTDVRNIQDYIGWRGFSARVQRDPFVGESGLVTVHYQVADEQAKPSRVGEIIISGNEVTKDRVIRRLLGLYPGQVLQYPELRLAQQALVRSQLFENSPEKGIQPLVYVDPKTEDSEYKNIDVVVKEAPTGSFMLGVGVNSNDGLVGNIVLNERNFDILRPPTSFSDIFNGTAWRGGGQEFRIEASPGTLVQRYTVSFREPYLFDLPYSFGVSGYYWDRIYNEDTEHRLGMRVVLGKQLNRYWSVSAAVRTEMITIDNVSAFAPPVYQEVVGQNFLVAPRVTVTRDTRDSILKPTEGSIVEASYEQAFGSFTFPIFNVDARKYFTVWQRPDGSGKHVLALRSAFSWEGDNAPVYERFYGGGFTTIRGFEFRGVGPFTIGLDGNLYRTGGNFMFLNSLEYQIPIKANDHLYAVAFVDSGTVDNGITLNDYRVTAGFGLRIVVPMMGPVPIALDFAFPIHRDPADATQLFSFYVGLFR
jgi:outer membrane protein assembly complex protein YaeT